MLDERLDITLVSPKCKECGYSCGGIGKNLLTIDELARVPAKCFVDEVDLTEGDKKIISNPKRDGALVALIDSLTMPERTEIQETIGSIDPIHYGYNERVWVSTAIYFFGQKNQRDPKPEEFLEINKENDSKYRVEYMLLFPHLTEINEKATPMRIAKLEKFLTKASEVAAENIKKYGYCGACGLFTEQMRRAQKLGAPYVPSYTKVILEQDF